MSAPEGDQGNWYGAFKASQKECERLRIGHDRYETARRMNPRQWADAWAINLSTGKPFDEIIDNLRPFMFPNVKLRGAL